MAAVHLGRILGAAGFSRTVAIKRLHAHFARDPAFVAMFTDEARIAARVQHPNVVQTLDVVSRDGELFLVMEYTPGESLSNLVSCDKEGIFRNAVPVPMCVSMVMGLLDGLHAAHEAINEKGSPLGIVHRDVSPHNVLVGTDGVARVLDFGIAKARWRLQTTQDGGMKGKVAYMAPEQFSADVIDRRVDVYAASVVLWEILAGKRLFFADTPYRAMHDITNAPVPRLDAVSDRVPACIADVVQKGLARNVDERYRTAHDMAVALEELGIVASPRDVGRWVEQTSRESLEKRRRLVASIERRSEVDIGVGSVGRIEITDDTAAPRVVTVKVPLPGDFATPDESGPSSAVSADGVAQETSVSVVTDNAEGERRSRRRALLGLGGAVALLGCIALVAFARSGSSQSPGASSSATVTAAPLAPLPPKTSATIGATMIFEPPRPPSSDVADGGAPVAPLAASLAPSQRSATPPPRSRVPATPAPRKSCSPPYTIDAEGVRVPKPECL